MEGYAHSLLYYSTYSSTDEAAILRHDLHDHHPKLSLSLLQKCTGLQ